MSETTAVAEVPETQYDPLELEIAERVVRPNLQEIVDEHLSTSGAAPNSKNHLYQMWCAKWGNTSRARFDLWIDMLGIRFVRIVKITGLGWRPPKTNEPSDAPYMDDSDSIVMPFDNETDGDI
jgi:hypothetical protein